MAWTTVVAVGSLVAFWAVTAGTTNIDSDHRFAWSENVGWTNWQHDTPNPGDGVLVDDRFLSGFLWAENVGWISVGDGVPSNGVEYANVDSSDFGVNIDLATGNLFGLAWGENVGWINFNTSSRGAERARFDQCEDRFLGYAWAENIGWINLDDATHFVGVTACCADTNDIVLVEQDFENSVLGTLPAPFIRRVFGAEPVGGSYELNVSNEQSFSGSQSLKIHNALVPQPTEFIVVGTDVNIPFELHPVAFATFSLRRYIVPLSNTPGVTMSIAGNPDIGIRWSSDGSIRSLHASPSEVIGAWRPGEWQAFKLDFDFVRHTLAVSIDGKPAGIFVFAPDALQDPVLRFLQHTAVLSGETATYFDDDVFISITPLNCVPFPDCNGNGLADACDIADGTSIDLDGNGIPDECDVSEDCNENGVLDVDEIDGAQSTSVFAEGMSVPEDIVASAGSYPSGFLVPDAAANVVYHVGVLGGNATVFASSVGSVRGAAFVPDTFGGQGDRLFVASTSGTELFSGFSILEIGSDGSVSPFAALDDDTMANGLVYIPEHIGGQIGGNLFVVSQRRDFPIHLVNGEGSATAIARSLNTRLFTPALAPSDFGDFGDNVFATTLVRSNVYAIDPETLVPRLFASVPSSGSAGLRQLAFSPVGWAALLDPNLVSERVLLVSVASSGNPPAPGTGAVTVWDQRGRQVAVLRSGPTALGFEPRGLLFVGDELLISDAAEGHGWLVRARVEDFGKGDCDGDGILDECELDAGASDCNANRVPDVCEADCNANGIPDQCDIASGSESDCNGNFIPDACEHWTDCNTNGVPDRCDIADGVSQDCNENGMPDSCELMSGFPAAVVENTTGFPDRLFAGAPSPQFAGIAGQAVTFDFGTARFVIDLPGPDLSVYEGGGPEFDTIDILVSADGVNFVSIGASEAPLIRIPGDEISSGGEQGRSYDLSGSGLAAVRFVKIDGNGDSIPVGNFDGFDLNGIGAIHLDADCDGNGTPDECQGNDFDGDGFIDPCDFDIDNDGIGNDADVCDFTPSGVPTDQHGRPFGDWNIDCFVTLADYEFFAVCFSFSGPGVGAPFSECLTVFDADEDGDVDLMDAAVFQQTFGAGQ